MTEPYDPTPEEIAEACAKMKAGWTMKAVTVYPTGVILCTGRLIACFRYEAAWEALERGRVPTELGEMGWRQSHVRAILEHPESFGPLCLVITDRVRVYPPVRVRGKQGLWEWGQ